MEYDQTRDAWRKTIHQLQLLVLLCVVFGVGAFFGSQYTAVTAQNGRIQLSDEASAAFQPLYETYNLIEEEYIDDVDPMTLIDGAIDGMVNALGDQHTIYITPEDLPNIESRLSGEFVGIGVVISEIEETGEIEVITVFDESPAMISGVREGDIFVEVDGEDVTDSSITELAAIVRGPEGSTVNIKFRRDDEFVDLDIVRATIEIPNVEAEMLEDNIGYIRMIQFSALAREQVDEAISQFDTSELNGLILDLRGNPGGYLDTATEIAGLFLNKGTILIEEFGTGESQTFRIEDGKVYQDFENGQTREYSDNAAYLDLDIPIVVLVDAGSASASELVAGAWQDNGVATIIGVTTFGKGTVQSPNRLINGGEIRLTIARWLTPNGNWITGKGITPDIVVEFPEDYDVREGGDLQLKAAIEFLETGDVVLPMVTIDQVE